MEGGIAADTRLPTPTLGRPSSSFRLRTQSLNTLRLRRIFDLFDQNGDGEITIEELALALDRLGLGADADADDLRSTVAAYIPTGRAGLAFEDFDALHRALGDALFGGPAAMEEEREGEEGTVEEDMREAFRVFDEDGDGFISAAELQAVLAKLGLPEGRSIARVQEMICSVDQNSDGRVDFGEFKHMMQGITVWGA
ncbi:probable calcium-binding protein CML27 [Musa acuminata AAA Group]|uniref:probable calcium-binding protein CML27 n=1 Tax=Musa acuminata AAA Group TaxID=214697 RepID=UPI0031D45654